MERTDWTEEVPDVERPNAARIYDYYLGGSHNFAADREVARKALAAWPELPMIMQANRAFLRRAVRYLVHCGIRQFLDVGSGIPTVGNTHEVAREALDPAEAVRPRDKASCRIVYVDMDPVAVAHSREILAGSDTATVVQADVRHPAQLLADPRVTETIDFNRPVGLLAFALLHFIEDGAQAKQIVATLRDALAPGSFLALSHASGDGLPEKAAEHQGIYKQTANPITLRSRPEISGFFDGFDLVEPGLVFLPLWRPDTPEDVDDHPERFAGLAGVGRLAVTG